MIKKSFALLLLVLVMFSIFGNIGLVSAEVLEGGQVKKSIPQEGDTEHGETEIIGGQLRKPIWGTEGSLNYYLKSYWDKTKSTLFKPVTWTKEKVFFPLIGKKVTWYETFGSFFYFFWVGLIAAVIALIILTILAEIGLLKNFIINKVLKLDYSYGGLKGLLVGIPLSSVLFGIFYGVLMIIPVLNRFLEIITLAIFTHLLGAFGEFFARIFLLVVVLVIIFFLPSIIRNVIEAKEKAKGRKILQKAVLKEAIQEVKVRQAMKDI